MADPDPIEAALAENPAACLSDSHSDRCDCNLRHRYACVVAALRVAVEWVDWHTPGDDQSGGHSRARAQILAVLRGEK